MILRGMIDSAVPSRQHPRPGDPLILRLAKSGSSYEVFSGAKVTPRLFEVPIGDLTSDDTSNWICDEVQGTALTMRHLPPSAPEVFHSTVAGLKFHDYPANTAAINVGDALTLELDPSNPADPDAVRILHQPTGAMMGFVSSRETGIRKTLLADMHRARITCIRESTRDKDSTIMHYVVEEHPEADRVTRKEAILAWLQSPSERSVISF